MTNKIFFLFAALIPLLLLPLTHANAVVKVSPAADQCIRNAILAYGLLTSSGSPVLPELNTTTAIIEDKCLNR